MVFYFKKKAAYEMRIGDWSSDVCSSDLPRTKSGKPRPIGIDAATVAALRAVRKRQAHERLLLGPAHVDHDLVLARPDGRPQHPEHFSTAFARRVARYRDRKSALYGKRVPVRLEHRGRRIFKKKKT